MHLRPYLAGDLPVMTDILAGNNVNSPLKAVVAPRRFEYYWSFRRGSLEYLKTMLMRPGAYCLVAESDPGDQYPGKSAEGGDIVGFAVFERNGTSVAAQRWRKLNQSWQISIESRLHDWKQKYNNLFRQRFDLDYAIFRQLNAGYQPPFDPTIFQEGWEVTMFFTDDSLHRRGIGTRLLQWVTQQAEDERVAAWVQASPAGFAAYSKAGFRSFREEHFEGIDKEGPGINYLVFEPSGMEDIWFEAALKAYEHKNKIYA